MANKKKKYKRKSKPINKSTITKKTNHSKNTLPTSKQTKTDWVATLINKFKGKLMKPKGDNDSKIKKQSPEKSLNSEIKSVIKGKHTLEEQRKEVKKILDSHYKVKDGEGNNLELSPESLVKRVQSFRRNQNILYNLIPAVMISFLVSLSIAGIQAIDASNSSLDIPIQTSEQNETSSEMIVPLNELISNLSILQSSSSQVVTTVEQLADELSALESISNSSEITTTIEDLKTNIDKYRSTVSELNTTIQDTYHSSIKREILEMILEVIKPLGKIAILLICLFFIFRVIPNTKRLNQYEKTAF